MDFDKNLEMLSVRIDGDGDAGTLGSGVLYISKTEEKYYIFTAKHIFYKDDEVLENKDFTKIIFTFDTNIEPIEIEKKNLIKYELYEKETPKNFKYDISIIELEPNEEQKKLFNEIEEIYLLEKDSTINSQSKLILTGFPSQNFTSEDIKNSRIRLDVNRNSSIDFDNESDNHKFNVKHKTQVDNPSLYGISGSPIFYNDNDARILLVGIHSGSSGADCGNNITTAMDTRLIEKIASQNSLKLGRKPYIDSTKIIKYIDYEKPRLGNNLFEEKICILNNECVFKNIRPSNIHSDNIFDSFDCHEEREKCPHFFYFSLKSLAIIDFLELKEQENPTINNIKIIGICTKNSSLAEFARELKTTDLLKEQRDGSFLVFSDCKESYYDEEVISFKNTGNEKDLSFKGFDKILKNISKVVCKNNKIEVGKVNKNLNVAIMRVNKVIYETSNLNDEKKIKKKIKDLIKHATNKKQLLQRLRINRKFKVTKNI